MTRWQRRARFLIAVAAVAFGVVVVRQMRPRTPPPATVPVPRTDPSAVFESTGGTVNRFNFSRENVNVTYEHQLMYSDGSSKLLGVKIIADEKSGEDSFTATAKEATVKKDATDIVMNGDVQLESASIRARTEHGTFSKADNTVRATGPVQVTEKGTTANGVGMTFDRNRDVLDILEQASVHMAGESGAGATDISAATATFDRKARIRRFEQNVRITRGTQTIEAASAVAYLAADDESRIDSVELHDGVRIATANAAAGALESLTGRDMTLKYAAGGQALEHVIVSGGAAIRVAGESGKASREIIANLMDIAVAADGATPTALIARESVQLTIPAEAGAPARTIQANTLDGKGEAGRGLTRALFSGNVQYRERGSVTRAAAADVLDVGLKPGLTSIEDAKFSRGVRFEEGAMTAVAAAARYDLDKGTLALSGSEPAALVPRVVTDQIVVDAAKIDLTLEGPKVKAGGGSDKVKSVLRPSTKEGEDATKMPSMLKQDQPVNVTATSLDYDGTTSMAAYTGSAQLWQADTAIKGETLIINGKTGDLTATAVTSRTVLEQTDKSNKKERVPSTATAKDLKYEDAERRLTYAGDAHMVGPEGDMSAAKIELYLKPSGDELDRAEAYESVTLREQNRKTTGSRMTYTTADERYVIVGTPVKILDQCERETTGKTLTFLKASDSIVIDGNQQTRTQTRGGGKCS